MCGSMVDIQSPTVEIRREKKIEEDRKKPQGKNIIYIYMYVYSPLTAERQTEEHKTDR